MRKMACRLIQSGHSLFSRQMAASGHGVSTAEQNWASGRRKTRPVWSGVELEVPRCPVEMVRVAQPGERGVQEAGFISLVQDWRLRRLPEHQERGKESSAIDPAGYNAGKKTRGS
jgi:hypothetical protein